MFTQCPGCSTAFRVSAEVLKRAVGQVRCGGCGVTFNALNRLSEDLPQSAPRAQPNEPEPELTADTGDTGEVSPPGPISVDQSAALLKTLDELAGSDVQLEDTGVEWRVLDSDTEDDELDADKTAAAEMQLDADAEPFPAANAMRFDDNTLLPDDFGVNVETPVVPDDFNPAAESPAQTDGFEDLPVDLALGDPDEWEQLLGEVDESDKERRETVAAQVDDNSPQEDLFDKDEEAELALFEESEGVDEGDGRETSIDEDLIAAAFEAEAAEHARDLIEDQNDQEDDRDSNAAHHVPPQTAQEKTIDMMIDEDIMRLAAEGNSDGNSSSIVVDEQPDFENSPLFETIVMEGESVHTGLDDSAAVSRRFDDPKPPVSIPASHDEHEDSGPMSRRMIAGAIALALLFTGQVLHQSREALATLPAFNQTAGPIYRFLGSPLTPDWDITGWRFEVSKGETDENGELLTIYSRIGNASDRSLPYPLVHLSLTDRFEEVVGSKVLEPREYLAGNPDPRKTVAPGNTFNAVILIESPARDATGFKLNICYRLASGQLRCAIEDFK